MEDVHWADPSTLELLGLVINQVPTARLHVLLTFRPEFSPPWAMRSHMAEIILSRLGGKQVREMVGEVTGGKALPVEVIQQIVAKTDGVPLFVEELIKMVVESGWLREADGHYELTGPLPSLMIPTTLHDSLMARLDRLGSVKEIAQLGATLGREFSYELLKEVSSADEATLQKELRQLVEAEFIYQQGLLPQSRYSFKHALIQDTAYQSLLKGKRREYHQQIAQALEERFPEISETQPELVAYHYTEAGLAGQAIPYWQRAGQRAVQRSANVEAVSHLTKGLELLKTLPDTPEHTQQELMLQMTLSVPLVRTKGYAAPEVEKAYIRARELCQQVGKISQIFPVLYGLWAFYLLRCKLQTAHELGEQLLTLAQRQQDPDLLMKAHTTLGNTLFFLGGVASARKHIEQGIILHDSQQHRSQASAHYLNDPGVTCLSSASWVLWYLGYPDQALNRSHEALVLAQELSHPHSLAFALYYAITLHQFRREGQAAQERAEAAITVSNEQGFPLWLAGATIRRGGALAEQGQVQEGIAQTRQGLAAWQAIGAELGRTHFLALLAEAHGQAGQVAEGLAALTEALDLVNKTEERYYEAELYRLKGELLLAQVLLAQEGKKQKLKGKNEEVSEAEECFRQAIDIARRQSAKSLELRAVMSLSRLWQQQDKKEEARELLASVYHWFTEGFDTKDLQEAKALLEELT